MTIAKMSLSFIPWLATVIDGSLEIEKIFG